MASSQLDRIVKGAPPPNVSPEQVASAARRPSTSSSNSITAPHPPPSDPTSNLPSSPPQIYLNLLILESSLRAQYLSLNARLRLHLLLLGALALWTLTFTYLLFLRPREDGKGTGGSVYWVVDTVEKMGFVGGAVTWCLVWGTGMWDRGIRWPRRWVGITNRGLRGFNLKVVVIRGPWWKEILGYINILDPLGWWVGTKGMRFELMPRDADRPSSSERENSRRWEDAGRSSWIEEDVAPGGDVIKLLLLPKPFSPDFREDWDTYRTTYWEKENERRAGLRRTLRIRNRERAKKEGGWLWWTGWRGWNNLRGTRQTDIEMSSRIIRERSSAGHLRDKKKRDIMLKESGHSRSSSRGSTPTSEAENRPRRPGGEEMRRISSSQGTGRRKKATPSIAPGAKSSPLNSIDARPSTPTSSLSSIGGRPLNKRSSNLSMSSSSDSEVKTEETPPTDTEIKDEEKS